MKNVLEAFALVNLSVHVTNDGLFADFSNGRLAFRVFLGAELICRAGLEKHLLVAENEFFVGLGGVLERVYDHRASISFGENQGYKVGGLYGEGRESQTDFQGLVLPIPLGIERLIDALGRYPHAFFRRPPIAVIFCIANGFLDMAIYVRNVPKMRSASCFGSDELDMWSAGEAPRLNAIAHGVNA